MPALGKDFRYTEAAHAQRLLGKIKATETTQRATVRPEVQSACGSKPPAGDRQLSTLTQTDGKNGEAKKSNASSAAQQPTAPDSEESVSDFYSNYSKPDPAYAYSDGDDAPRVRAAAVATNARSLVFDDSAAQIQAAHLAAEAHAATAIADARRAENARVKAEHTRVAKARPASFHDAVTTARGLIGTGVMENTLNVSGPAIMAQL